MSRPILLRPAACRGVARCAFASIRHWRIAVTLIACVLLAACAGPARNGASFDNLTKTVGAPKAGHARVVVLRDQGFGGIFDSGWRVHLDGAQMGDIKTGTFAYRDITPGSHKLTFSRPGDFARESHNTFTAAPGQTYFFRLELNEKGRLVQGGSSTGLAGLVVTSAMAHGLDDRGLFDFTPLDEGAARTAIAELRLAE